MEGVMMRGTKALAVAVRQPDGNIVLHTEPLDPKIYAGRLSKIPFLRGLTGLWDALVLGIRTLMWSAETALGPEEEVQFKGPVAWGTVAVSLILGVGLLQGFHAFEFSVLRNMAVGWLICPVIAFVLAAAGFAIFGAG